MSLVFLDLTRALSFNHHTEQINLNDTEANKTKFSMPLSKLSFSSDGIGTNEYTCTPNIIPNCTIQQLILKTVFGKGEKVLFCTTKSSFWYFPKEKDSQKQPQ